MKHRRLQSLAVLTVAAYLVAWLSIGPVLSFCRCVQGHTALATRIHAEPACGHHHGHDHDGETSPQPSHAPQSCDDTPVVGEALTIHKSLTTDLSTVFVPVAMPAMMQPVAPLLSLEPGFNFARDPGPPRDLSLGLRATILQV